MESQSGEYATYLLSVQIRNHALSFINSMSLKCAIDLGILDIINNYGQPMPLSQLISSLQIHPSKTQNIYRLMRILTHSGFFSQQNINATENNELEVSYVVTDASKLLLKDRSLSLTPYLHLMFDPITIMPWYQLSNWLKNEDPTPFYTQNGRTLWDYASRVPEFNQVFNNAMASETEVVSSIVIEKCNGTFLSLESLVDVGGGTGTMAKAIAKMFPQLECIVFDLPHVVADLQGSEKNLKYVGGDMFESIPEADAILFKWIFHDWNDEECIKILKKCKEALIKKGRDGKVIIIDMVLARNNNNEKSDDDELIQQKLFLDMIMMVMFNGKERNENEWAKLFFSAGFNNYKITPIQGVMYSLIEVFL